MTDLARIRVARAASPVLYLTGACGQETCPAREIDITVKDHDHDVIDMLARHGLTCPVCRSALTLRDVETGAQRAERDARDARGEVNAQMYARDQQTSDGEVVGIPFSVFEDERLPPTRAGWFHYTVITTRKGRHA